MVSLAGRPKKVERRPLEPNAARDSQNTERKKEKRNHHRQAHNNSDVICDSGSGKNSRAAFFWREAALQVPTAIPQSGRRLALRL
jgi:hypothetical protein